MLGNAVAALETINISWLIGVGLVCIVTIMEKASDRYKPWSWLAEQFGKAANREIAEKLDTLSNKVMELEAADKRQDEERDRQLAINARKRILGVADEIRKGIRHSEEYFNDALDDISNYHNYCREHPDFENSKAMISSRIIEETYQQCLIEDDFE